MDLREQLLKDKWQKNKPDKKNSGVVKRGKTPLKTQGENFKKEIIKSNATKS